jgi:nucleoside phosphorylase
MSEAATAIIVAVAREARPLIRRFGLARANDTATDSRTWIGRYDGRALRLIATGMGPTNARQTVLALLAHHSCDRVIVAGLCGALDPALQVGDLVPPDEVLDAATGRTHRRPIPHRHGGRLVSVARVIASPAEKAGLFARHAAAAVDMETAAIAAVCESHEVPWLCLRAVSDTADQALPDGIERLIDDHGRLRPWPAVRQLARAPGTIPALAHLARGTARAAEALAAALPPLLADLQAH